MDLHKAIHNHVILTKIAALNCMTFIMKCAGMDVEVFGLVDELVDYS